MGRDKTFNKVKIRYWWPNMWADTVHLLKTCDICQKTNPKTKGVAPLLTPIKVRKAIPWHKVMAI